MKELLIPAGNFECLKVAINAGADAVYLGGKRFGARAFAGNFTDDELVSAIKLCHLYGVKIYVTVNTLVYESELNDVINYIKFLHQNGVDAVIIQDIGVIKIVHELMPNLEIHASTQVHTTNNDTINYLEQLGVKRIVYAREVSINSINNHHTKLEKEAFIHGALCVSYSGECLMSSMMLNRSGNRGECAQLCRMPYKLLKDHVEVKTNGKYLLSTKDLNTANYFDQIMQSDIYSLKVEGRMKSPEYVGCVTKFYRSLIDSYYQFNHVVIDYELLNDLTTIFNREFTKGFIFNANNEELMNIKTANHQGTPLGKVINIDKKFIYIKLTNELMQGDGIRFNETNDGGNLNYLYNQDKLLVNHGNINDVILVDNKFKCRIGDTVNKTLSVKLIKKYTLLPEKKIPVNFIVSYDNNIIVTISDGVNKVSKNIECEIAQQCPTSKDAIIDKLAKLGNTPFICSDVNIDIPTNLFINMSLLNQTRRLLVDELIDLREKIKVPYLENEIITNNELPTNDFNISVLVRNEHQLNLVINQVDRVYVTSEELYLKYQDNPKVYFRTNRIGGKVNYPRILVTELSNINSGEYCILDYYLNITNHATVNTLNGNVNTLSVELTDQEITNICNYFNNKTNFELIIYGTYELMLMKYCMINLNDNHESLCHACIDHQYTLVDSNDNQFKLLNDQSHITHLMSNTKVDKISKIDEYYQLGIHNFRLELFDENDDEITDLLNKLNNQKKNYC